jgi:hypothetical protein
MSSRAQVCTDEIASWIPHEHHSRLDHHRKSSFYTYMSSPGLANHPVGRAIQRPITRCPPTRPISRYQDRRYPSRIPWRILLPGDTAKFRWSRRGHWGALCSTLRSGVLVDLDPCRSGGRQGREGLTLPGDVLHAVVLEE